MTDNRTTELLCNLLEERGIEYFTDDDEREYNEPARTTWDFVLCGYEMTVTATEFVGIEGKLYLEMDFHHAFTPEQAIAATLGDDEKLLDLAHNAWGIAVCAMQGMPIPASWGNAVEKGLRERGIDVDELPYVVPDAALGGGECEQVLVDCDDGLMPPFTAYCSKCGKQWGYTPKFCPECGARVARTRDERKAVKR